MLNDFYTSAHKSPPQTLPMQMFTLNSQVLASMLPFTCTHANGMGLRVQWATGRCTTLWPALKATMYQAVVPNPCMWLKLFHHCFMVELGPPHITECYEVLSKMIRLGSEPLLCSHFVMVVACVLLGAWIIINLYTFPVLDHWPRPSLFITRIGPCLEKTTRFCFLCFTSSYTS